MKLQIKTLNQKSLVIDIEDTKTVYELKKELSLYPDIGVKPELQKLIYAGKILENDDKLSVYNIDVKKFLVIMILKQPLTVTPGPAPAAEPQKTESVKEQPANSKQEAEKVEEEPKAKVENTSKVTTPTARESATQARTTTAAAAAAPASTPADDKTNELVTQIMSMGYPENEVRRALEASFNNPERAVEFLIEGLPSTNEVEAYSEENEAQLNTPFDELLRNDPMYQTLRSTLQRQPELLDAAIQRIGETNPSFLNLISENQGEFLSMLLEDDFDYLNDDDIDDEMDDDDDDMD